MMDTEEEAPASALPTKKKRGTIIYAVLYKHPVSGELSYEECITRTDARRFVNSLNNPDLVIKLYRVSAIISMRKKIVMTF